ncbi:MAG: GPP34 family phosphoprotein, partial [Bacteroidales bacterium]
SSLDKTKGKFLIDSLSLNYGLSGAILMQLSNNEQIKIEQKKIIAVKNDSKVDSILSYCLELINSSKKTRSAKYWVNKIGSKTGNLRNQILRDLCDKRILKMQKSKVLWVFTLTRYPVIDNTAIDDLRNLINDIVFNYQKAELKSLLLLSLIYSCKLTRILFPDKNHYKKANERIKEITKNIELGEVVSQTIKEI